MTSSVQPWSDHKTDNQSIYQFFDRTNNQSENLHKMLLFCVCVCVFFLITQYDNVLLKKFKIETHLNDVVPLIWTENIALSVCIGSVRLYLVRDLRLRCPHRTSIGALFTFRLPASAPLVGANGGAGGSVLIGVVDSGDSLHTPNCKDQIWTSNPTCWLT